MDKTVKSYRVISDRGLQGIFETRFDIHPKQPDRLSECLCYANSLRMDKNNVLSVKILIDYEEELKDW